MYSITKIGNNVNTTNIREFVADKREDIEQLPHINKEGVEQNGDSMSNNKVFAGSMCICLEDGSVWMLGNDDEWHEL